MTAEQSLVGAMGCASWRSHYRLREYAALAPIAGVIRGGASPRIESADVLDLNEVGVTDAVLAAIWRFGPSVAAYAISSHAEAKHLGADIAFVHLPTSRILLYQAKLARYDDSGAFRLKSPVTRKQLDLLRRRHPIEIQGIRYQRTGRLALYQQDLTPHLGHCPAPFMPGMWQEPWWSGPGPLPAGPGGTWGPMPKIGRRYYETVLARCGCSPSGVLAALVPSGREPVTSVAVASTWPWEFQAHQWLRQASPHGGRQRADADADEGFGGPAPDFGQYAPTTAQPPPSNRAARIARELAERLRLPTSIQLHVIILP